MLCSSRRGPGTRNRAATHLKLGNAEEALADAEAAIRLRPEWEKGFFRKGCALEVQGDLEKALEAFRAGLDLNPGNKELRNRAKQVERSIQAARKAAAVAKPGAQRRRRSGGGSAFNIQMVDGPPRVPGPAEWAQGLSVAEQYEWLTDCYRMRIDDGYVYGGGNLHGLYNPDATKESVVEDFLVFCKLAVQHGVVPSGWDWPAFLCHAAKLLPYAFEKSDAKEKWGGENVFRAISGSRSLRATGEVVMGSSCMEMGPGSREANLLYQQVCGHIQVLLGGGAEAQALLEDVGGAAAWAALLRAMPAIPSMF